MRSGARASRYPPRWRAQLDNPQKAGRGRRIGQWQQLNPPFRFKGFKTGAGRKANGTVGRKFRGESHNKVDSKGRVSIPASFRRVLEASDPNWSEGAAPELVIVYGDHRRNFLECYTIEAIEEVDAQIGDLPRGSTERKILERLFHGQSFPTTVDETGRLVLPMKLREKIKLEKEAFFIAAGDTFQIWKPETYESEELARTEAYLDALPDDFDPLIFLDKAREG